MILIDWQKENLLRRIAYWTLIPGDDFDKLWTRKLLLHSDRTWDVWEQFIAKPLGRLHCMFYKHIYFYGYCQLCGKKNDGSKKNAVLK
tara:strand:- start:349 stop:612 length:264 start_codon:yes stop_codon:yes gene_type:complete